MIPWHTILVIGGILITIGGFIAIIVVIARNFSTVCPSGQTYNTDQKKCVEACGDNQMYDPNKAIPGCRDKCNGPNQHFSYRDNKCVTCQPYEAWNIKTEHCIGGLNPCLSPFDKCMHDFKVVDEDVPADACGWNAPVCMNNTSTTPGTCSGPPVPEKKQGTSAKYSDKPACSGKGTCAEDENGKPTGCVCDNVPDTISEIDKLVAARIDRNPEFMSTEFGKACYGKKRYFILAGR